MKKKEIVEISLTSLLVIILLFIIANSLNKIPKSKYPEIKKTAQPVNLKEAGLRGGGNLANKVLAPENFRKQEEESKELQLKRDPFTTAPIAVIEKSSSRITLNGILYDKDNPMAIINNEIVKIGGNVGVNKVIDIRSDRVILNDGTKDFEIRLE